MKTILLCVALGLALQADGCGDTQAAQPAPKMPETGREAMRVDGARTGRMERQADGTYLLRYTDGKADKVSANEVILMPEGGK